LFDEKNQIDQAKKHLQWAVSNASDEGYLALARLRLAGLLIQSKEYDLAVAQLSNKAPSAFQPLFDDRLGDIAILQGQTEKALNFYQKSWKGFDGSADYRRIVEVKLASLGQAPDTNPVTQDKK
jgi:predicted negative regulator of RcsB-dependent stress response